MFPARPAAAAVSVALALAAVTTPTAAADQRPPAEEQRITPPDPRDKSIAFYVGSDLTDDGSVLLGGFGHEPSSHWLEVVPRQKHDKDDKITVGATGEADIPGKLTKIPQVEETAKYITMNYSEFAGFPAPLTNGGLNEHGVAARDVWLDGRDELVQDTKTPQEGPQYSDLSRIAMERAHTAEEAVDIVGDLIDEYGYTTYGGNSHLFADDKEGWVLTEYPGGEGLWAAERLGPDDVRVSYPGYIGEFPTDFEDDPDYKGSENIVDHAEQKKWWDPDSDDPFNLHKAYGLPFPGQPGDDEDAPYRYPPDREKELKELAPVSLDDMKRLVRDPRWSDDRSGYGQAAALNKDVAHPDLNTLWVAPTASVTAPYIPFHIGTDEIPPEYSQHRYLTSGAADSYLDPEYAPQEATRYPVRTFKRLMYYTCDRPEEFLGEVTDVLEGYEAQISADLGGVEKRALDAYESGDPAEGRTILTEASDMWAMDALDLGDYMVDDIEQRTKDEWGIREPKRAAPGSGTTASAQSQDMALPEDAVSARDRITCDMGGGWADGSTLDRKGQAGDPDNVPDFRAASDESGIGALPWLPIAVSGVVGIAIGFLIRRRRAAKPAAESAEG